MCTKYTAAQVATVLNDLTTALSSTPRSVLSLTDTQVANILQSTIGGTYDQVATALEGAYADTTSALAADRMVRPEEQGRQRGRGLAGAPRQNGALRPPFALDQMFIRPKRRLRVIESGRATGAAKLSDSAADTLVRCVSGSVAVAGI